MLGGRVAMKSSAQFVLTWLLLTAGCASVEPSGRPVAVEEIMPGLLQGYLATEEMPDSLTLVLPPPAEGSAAFARDEEASRESFALRGTPRWDLAIKDANLSLSI